MLLLKFEPMGLTTRELVKREKTESPIANARNREEIAVASHHASGHRNPGQSTGDRLQGFTKEADRPRR
jgi:hypothetical protein